MGYPVSPTNPYTPWKYGRIMDLLTIGFPQKIRPPIKPGVR